MTNHITQATRYCNLTPGTAFPPLKHVPMAEWRKAKSAAKPSLLARLFVRGVK